MPKQLKRRKRKFLQNPDGSRSSEKTLTVGTPRGFMNIPSIDPERGMSLTIREGIKTEKRRTGGKPTMFMTQKAATKAAAKRSAAGGRDRKKKKKKKR